jgi:hypothetical protein
MLSEFKCWTRRCKHYDGVKWLGEDGTSERSVCKAFPDGIPPEIAYGDNLHLEPIKGQKNDIVFESEEWAIK